MGKLGNFELNAEQRRILELKNQRRAELRAYYLKQMHDPHRGALEGGHLVNRFLPDITSSLRLGSVMSSLCVHFVLKKTVIADITIACHDFFHVSLCLYFPFQFDPAFQRFHSMKASHFEFFKPNAKSFTTAFFVVVAPIIVFALCFKKQRGDFEERLRAGEISYRDRKFKYL